MGNPSNPILETTMQITVIKKTHFGSDHYYPHNCRTAEQWLGILGQKSFTLDNLRAIKAMECQVKVVHEEPII